MPELPEVEVVKKALIKKILNKTITDLIINDQKIIKYPINSKEFKEKILFQKINDIERRGKNLIFILDDYVLISHLRMEGKYFYGEKKLDYNHNMISFQFNKKDWLFYLDSRKFGTMHLLDKKKYLNIKPLNKLGYEPFDINLNVFFLKEKWKNKRQPIKNLLLNQEYIAGIGNIYACEILFKCKIHPEIFPKFLLNKDYENIIFYVKKIMNDSIKNGGCSVHTFSSLNNIVGNYQKYLKVYNRHGKNCFDCNNLIQKKIINGRGTYYCSMCQKNNF